MAASGSGAAYRKLHFPAGSCDLELNGREGSLWHATLETQKELVIFTIRHNRCLVATTGTIAQTHTRQNYFKAASEIIAQ